MTHSRDLQRAANDLAPPDQELEAQTARDIFCEISLLLNQRGDREMAELANHISRCYGDPDGQEHRDLPAMTLALMGWLRWTTQGELPKGAEASQALGRARCLPAAGEPYRAALRASE